MTIYEYMKETGKLSFKEEKINEIDYALFSFLSYADYTKIFKGEERYTIEEIVKMHNQLYPKRDHSVIAVKEGHKILKEMSKHKRYKDCIIYNHSYIANDRVQFGAISIEYEPNKVFVSFEGTDQTFVGWKENFILSYDAHTESHEYAIKYLNKYFTLNNKDLIVGGHSKGGNLALVGSMYCNILVRRKIKKVFGADSPGLLESEYKSSRYERIKKKYLHIIPNNSVVGILLYHSNDKVIKATTKTILTHNILYWNIIDNRFEKSTLNPLSKELDKEIKKWVNQCNKEDKEEFVNEFVNILKKANVTSILDLKEKKSNIIKLIYDSKGMSPQAKKVVEDLISILIKCFKDTKKEELKNSISNIFTILNRGKNAINKKRKAMDQ